MIILVILLTILNVFIPFILVTNYSNIKKLKKELEEEQNISASENPLSATDEEIKLIADSIKFEHPYQWVCKYTKYRDTHLLARMEVTGFGMEIEIISVNGHLTMMLNGDTSFSNDQIRDVVHAVLMNFELKNNSFTMRNNPIVNGSSITEGKGE